MTNPYRTKPDTSFWKRSVALADHQMVDPVTAVKFQVGRTDKIATAGSCFAQHIARTLAGKGFGYFIAEQGPAPGKSFQENYGVFSARFGNIYTVRQLLQLFLRAYGLFEPEHIAWPGANESWIDPFRPNIETGGFASEQDLIEDREWHLAAVRSMFENCDIFIFTLGLTESWISNRDGSVFPLAPGVVSSTLDEEDYRFHNFRVSEIREDLEKFLKLLRIVNSTVRVLLTVSPVPLIATYEDKHVLPATIYSKSVLRVAAEETCMAHEWVDYFPSFEMITGAHTRGAYFEDDLREVRMEGVGYVMNAFSRHYLTEVAAAPAAAKVQTSRSAEEEFRRQVEKLNKVSGIICDEESIERNI